MRVEFVRQISADEAAPVGLASFTGAIHRLLVLSTASATHSSETATASTRTHHHRSPFGTATAHFHPVPTAAPSMHQNHLNADSHSLLSSLDVDPVLADAQATDAAVTRPAPPVLLVPDLAEATPQPQEEGSASTTTTTLLLHPVTVAMPRARLRLPPCRSDTEQGLQQLSRVLTSLGYNEMASEAPLLARAPPLARWPGAITVGFCIKVVTERGRGGPSASTTRGSTPTGVEVSHPELYNDGRYVVHGLPGFLHPLTHSCFDFFPVLSPCYNVSGAEKVEVPELSLVFVDGAPWDFPTENYFIRLEPEGIMCLAILSTPRSGMSIIGNYQQQNLHVLYDLEHKPPGLRAEAAPTSIHSD